MGTHHPETELYSLVDHNIIRKVKKNNHSPLNTAVCDEILGDTLLTRAQVWKYPRTIIGTREYFQTLTANICGARHERADCEYSVKTCPIRATNIACLHGLEIRRHALDNNLVLSSDIWGVRVFATAYVLDRLGYSVPLTVDNLSRERDKMDKYDHWEPNSMFDFDTLGMYNDSNPNTEAFQKEISEKFRTKYISPIQSAFESFWNAQVIQD